VPKIAIGLSDRSKYKLYTFIKYIINLDLKRPENYQEKHWIADSSLSNQVSRHILQQRFHKEILLSGLSENTNINNPIQSRILASKQQLYE